MKKNHRIFKDKQIWVPMLVPLQCVELLNFLIYTIISNSKKNAIKRNEVMYIKQLIYHLAQSKHLIWHLILIPN